MPELPEVEVVRNNLENNITGFKIVYTIIRNSNLRWPISKEIYNVQNEIILSIQRRAKYLLLKMLNGWIIIHLGISGKLLIVSKECPLNKHDHVDMLISNNKILRYNDPRRFGAFLWANDIKNHKLLMHIGPEPLSKEFNVKYLETICKKKKVFIKVCIMDNKVVAGIGNIYANESLFLAKIRPDRLTYSLSNHECSNLVRSIKIVLFKAINQGGTTLKDFLQSNGTPGYFTKELKVYGGKNKLCSICKQSIIVSKLGMRSTFFCTNCQN